MSEETENNKTKLPKLTPKEKRFCKEYILQFNATKAAISVGYTEKSARVTGCKLLTKANVQKEIEKLKNNLAETAEISALRILKEHEKLAFSSIAHLHNTWLERADFENLTEEQKACIKSIATKVLKKNIGTSDEPDIVDVEYVKIELYDKQKSLDSLSRMLGYEAPVKTEITGKDGKDLMPTMYVIGDDDFIKEFNEKLQAEQATGNEHSDNKT